MILEDIQKFLVNFLLLLFNKSFNHCLTIKFFIMKHLKTIFACLLMAVLSIGQVWAVDQSFAFSTIGSTGWGGYADHTVTCADDGTVYMNASKQSGTITDIPVTKGQPVSFVLSDNTKSLSAVSFTCRQWTTKAQTITLKYSTNGGSSYNTLSPSVTSSNFSISSSSLPTGTNAVQITFSSQSNQVGIQSMSYTLAGSDPDPVLQSIAISGAPTTKNYENGNAFDPTGLVVTGTYDVGDPAAITSGITWTACKTESGTYVALDDEAVALAKDETGIYVKATVGEITSPAFHVTGLTVTAATPKITIDGSATGITTTDEAQTITAGVGSFGGIFKQYSTTALWFTKGSGYIYNTASFGYIRKITINYKSGGAGDAYQWIKMGSSAMDSYEAASTNGVKYETSAGGSSNTFVVDGDYEYFCLSVSNKNLQASSIVIEYDNNASAPKAATPTFPTGDENFVTSTSVTLACTTEGAKIYYTTNGDVPTSSSTLYNGAIPVSATTTIKAIAVADGMDNSNVAEKTFTKATILTVAEALTIIEGLDNKTATTAEYYVSGVVSTVTALTVDGTGEYYISADGTKTSELQVYKGKWVGGANFTSTDQLIEGDDVTIKGKLKKYNSYKELDQNNEVVAYKLKARLAWSEESYEADLSSSNTFPSLTNTNGVSVSYSSTNTDAATINPSTGAISLVAVGSTTIKATFTGNETYKANEVSYTLTVSNSVLRADISFEENGGSTVTDLTEQSNLPDPLPTITKAGYNFGGWWTTSDFQAGTEAVAGAAVESTDDIVLYAKWLDPYTVTEALTMIDALADNGETGNVYVSGIVCTAPSNLISGEYLTYYISVDGTETNRLQVYKGKNVGNIAFTDKEDVQAADQVVVFGPLKKFKQGDNIIPEFNTGNYLYSLSRKAEAGIEWGVASFDAYIGESNTFPTLTNPNSLTVAYSSSNETAAMIDPATGAITLGTTPNVNTTITASFAGNSSYKAAEVSYTLNVYNPTNPGTITYEENGGSEVADVTTPVDNFPDPLPEPTKENYIFAGWWTTSTFNDGTQAVAGAPMDGNVILYAKWTEIPVWAYTYTSNVTLSTEGGTSASAAKVKFYGEEGDGYDAIKAGTGSAQGAVVVNVPAGATALHFHAYSWYNETVELTVSAPTGVTVTPSAAISINQNSGISNNSPFTLAEGSDPKTDAYYAVSLSGNTEATNITISATSGKRFVLFGVNQEGGLVLESISITGTATALEYNEGDHFSPAGLGVTGHYSDASTAPITEGIVWAFDPDPLTEGTTSVSVTATAAGFTSAAFVVDGLTVAGAAPLSPWATTWTSNLDDITGSKVKFYGEETEYAALKAGTGSAAGSATLNIPAQATELHLHAYGWNSEDVTLSITAPAGVTVTPASITLNRNSGFASNSPFTLAEGSTPQTDAYYALSLSGNTDAIELTITATAGKRFLLFGVNQEGGQLPVLESIEIKGDLTTKTGYKAGDALNLDGLTVEATYSIGGVAQTPVDITDKLGDGLTLTYDPLVENQTEVTITATYGDKSDDITITGLDPVASADPKIYVSTLNVNFASVEVGEAVPANETVTITLTNVAAATATLDGEGFSITPATLTASGDITVSVVASTASAANYSATLTISDDATENPAESKVINLSFAVIEPVVNEEYELVSDVNTLAAGDQIIIVAENAGTYYTLDGSITSQYFPSTAVSISAGIITAPSTSAIILGKDEDNWTMSMGGQLIGATAAKKASLGNTATATNTWTIAIAENVATITNTTTSYGSLQFNYNNGSNSRFLNYTSTQTAVAIYKKVAAPAPEYETVRSGLVINRYYTVCLPKKVTAIKGASFWTLHNKSQDGATAYLEEETNNLPFAAGTPFIIQATAANLEVVYEGAATEDAGTNGALHGTLVYMDAAALAAAGSDIYMLFSNELRPVGENNHLDANRAYVKLSELDAVAEAPQSAPGKRVRAMPMQPQVVTDIDAINASEKPMKMMINGQIFILRGEKMYDTTGRLVK